MLLNQTQPRSILQPRPYHQTSSHYPIHHQQFYESADQETANTYDLDLDGDHNNHSLSSSPISTQSLLSQYSGIRSSPLSTFDSIPTAAAARGTSGGSLFDFAPQSGQATLAEHSASLFANNDPMQTDAWHPATGHLTPRSAGRSSHQRESSLSSMGSNGPASPYSQNTSNPYIAVTDSATDGFHGMPSADDYNYQLVKSSPSITHDTFYTSYPNYTTADHSAIGTYPRVSAAAPRRKNRGLLQPEAPIGSRPVSVASSITSDSPATPAGEPEERQRTAINTVPKLDRTMTDIYNDELYSPSFTITSAAPTQMAIPSPSNELFAQRLQAANQHLSAVHSPVSASSRDRSPFRHGSPLAPMAMHEFPSPFNTGAQIREQNKALRDARAMQQQMGRSADTSTPQTISPKDAMLEFHEADGDNNFPLFPQQNTGGYDHDAVTKAVTQSQQAFDNMPLDTSAFNNYLSNPQLPQSLQIPQLPQQYPFISQRQQSSVPSLTNGSLAPSRMGSTDTGAADSHNNSPQRPLSTAADGGTYTCTYHGCTLRFDTPALLQKHKREGHRQAHGLGGSRRAESVGAPGMTSNLLNSQAGPHRCDRINPSTGKPCNTIFSRPYDLTRHEDTIHNARKQKVRCDLCTDEKTFSRADALTRHYRVCHPDVEFPGKQRRRGGHSG
ncbi:hypothetical protein B0H67DRAFT_604103 [Lasiosphaeris hirsuta]|uniref:C2H2-type domain-containing protein n=1 Tax=Lasiosphaeris hirsuta TaxID=260670 RepID=A0AA39ZX45_9PEZI|nr:hypothetical protein B0H67DRAFT_604103 [Lasiosphaeris hirsuta]